MILGMYFCHFILELTKHAASLILHPEWQIPDHRVELALRNSDTCTCKSYLDLEKSN